MLDLQQPLADERSRDYQRAALKSHQAQEMLGNRQPSNRFYASALDHLGHVLIEAGLNLRARYGRMDFGERLEA
ncbi:MAG: hypothetical protein KIS91_14845 [Anaerolineae bacterium]|nr:hypothetical protein [Anaerolineae bacterium]